MTAQLELSVMYGLLEVFVVKSREPSDSDFDFTNLNSVFGNKVSWVRIISVYDVFLIFYLLFLSLKTFQGSCTGINLLIRATGSDALFLGYLSTTTSNQKTNLLSGYPKLVESIAKQSYQFSSTVQCAGNSSFIATTISGSLPTFSVTNDDGVTTTATNSAILDYPVALNKRNSLSSFSLSTVNSSFETIVFREQTATDACPLHLMNGFGQFDRIRYQGNEQFYVFQVPSNVVGTIYISVEPIQVTLYSSLYTFAD
jgi:hypothetical protein